MGRRLPERIGRRSKWVTPFRFSGERGAPIGGQLGAQKRSMLWRFVPVHFACAFCLCFMLVLRIQRRSTGPKEAGPKDAKGPEKRLARLATH